MSESRTRLKASSPVASISKIEREKKNAERQNAILFRVKWQLCTILKRRKTTEINKTFHVNQHIDTMPIDFYTLN